MSDFKATVISVNSSELGGRSYGTAEWLLILFSRFKRLKYAAEWIEAETFKGTDVRPMPLLRIESATIWYEQNIHASLELCERYVEDIVTHGYHRDFAMKHSVVLREVRNRVGYLDCVYFAIDYFISQMLKIHDIDHNGQNKVSDFASLLGHFAMENAGATKQKIMLEIQQHLPDSMVPSETALVDHSGGKVPFRKSFEYLTLIRNSLHNNGFANKQMNNLVIGPFEFKGRLFWEFSG